LNKNNSGSKKLKLKISLEFTNKTEAYRRERQVKGWKNRERIETLINKKHSD